MTRTFRILTALAATFLLCAPVTADQQALSDFSANGSSLVWSPAYSGEMNLRISSPDGRIIDLAVDSTSLLDLSDLRGYLGDLPDGYYQWELRSTLQLDRVQLEALEAARDAGGAMPAWLNGAGDSMVQFGGFSVVGGALVADLSEEPGTARIAQPGLDGLVTGTPGAVDFATKAFLDTDVIVDGSLCVGVDCNTSGENFGFDTIRLKENNLRIKFDDTSSSGSFPNVDWQLIANDTNNGGENKFVIQDVTNNKNPFRIEANAPNNTVVVDSNGRLGVGTASPVLQIHTVDGNTPGLRLEQDGSSGFSSRIWDIAGNEINFFVRDITNSSALPFRIYAGTAGDTLVLRNNRMGAGTDDPSHGLHIRKSNGEANALIEERSSTSADRTLLEMSNNGAVRFDFTNNKGTFNDTSDDVTWFFQNESAFDQLNISKSGSGGTELVIRERLDAQGSDTLEVFGSITATAFNMSSSRGLKTDFDAVDPLEVLNKVAAMPVLQWRYKTEGENVRHMGPIAEEFMQQFSLGKNERTISAVDANGVAFAAIQGLKQLVEEKDEQIDDLNSRIEALEALVEKMAQP